MSDTSAATKRSLTFQDGSSHKFWTIELNDDSHTVHFGRVGTQGQAQTKSFDSAAEAKKSYDKLVAEKLKNGYADADGAAATTAAPAPAPRATKAKAKKAADESVSESTADSTTSAAKTAQSAPATAAPKFSANVTRQIDLEPTDWYAASFHPRPTLVRETPRAFDYDACLKILGKGKTDNWGWDTRWAEMKLPDAMSRQEAHFWLTAMLTERGRDKELSDFAKEFGAKHSSDSFDGQVDLPETLKAIHAFRRLSSVIVLPLANLFTPEELVTALLDQEGEDKDTDVMFFADGFQRYVRPYLTDQQMAALRKIVELHQDDFAPRVANENFSLTVYIAASLGMHKQISEFMATISDDFYQKNSYADHYQYPQLVLTGLDSPEAIASEWQRLKLGFRTTQQARGFLACTQFLALDWLAECICRQTNRDECEGLLKVLALVKAPEAAGPMLKCKLECKTPSLARQWLEENVGNAVTGLLPYATSRDKLGDGTIEYLRALKRQGAVQIIVDALKECSAADAKAKVQAEVIDREEKVYQSHDEKSTPAWLRDALDEAKSIKKKLPTWASSSSLPPLIVDDRKLNDNQLNIVLTVLAATPVGDKEPLLQGLREHVDKQLRDEFAWKLFQLWSEDGCPSKEKWAMGAIGHLGDDRCVMKLTPLVRAWPGESQHQRAVFGLECLRAIGSSVALMQLSGIAQKLKFKGLKSKAEEFVEAIAKEKGLTRDELEDRVVPDCGLDEQGKREFSFGQRSFFFVLGGDLKAMVRDADGKVRSDLPKPSGKDDAAVAEASVSEWKLIKKQIKEVASIQSRRLENAMITGRRWNQEDFRMLIVDHPLMTHLAQKLIWATYDAKGKMSSTFRISEERDFADANDDTLSIPDGHTVGIVHALELNEEARSKWGEVLGDYEIVAPFAQLGREVYALEGNEAKQDQLDRFVKLNIVAPTLVFTLEKLGWIRGEAMDGGCFTEHSKQFPAANVTAVIGYEGTVGMGYIDPNEELTLEPTYFIEGMRPPSCYGWADKDRRRLKLGEVNPIVISEVLADLQVLKSKAK